MEKKAPERKVRLREGDVFYVYDKRINKCIRGDSQIRSYAQGDHAKR